MAYLIVLLFSLLVYLEATLASGIELAIPLDPRSGIELGQGFDINSMRWRGHCAVGRELQTPSTEATLESSSGLSSVYSLESTSGSLTGGVSLLGGLAAVKAKTSFSSSWIDSDFSKGSLFRLDFGTSRWELRDLRPLLVLHPEESFLERCGTHVVVRLEIRNELLFLVKYLSQEQSWMEKIRWDVKSKGFWGLSKKSWSKENLQEGTIARAIVKVGLRGRGSFQELLSVRFGTADEIEITCHYPVIHRCQDLYENFEETLTYLKGVASEGESYLKNRDLATAAILVPYKEAGPHFAGVEAPGSSVQKIFFLNEMRRQYFELKAQTVDARTLDLPQEDHLGLNSKIENIQQKIATCEGMNLCE